MEHNFFVGTYTEPILFGTGQVFCGKGKGIMIWETSDDPLTASDKDLIYALTHCKWCQLKIMGKDGMQHVKMISDSQFDDFRRTLKYYRLKGGTF